MAITIRPNFQGRIATPAASTGATDYADFVIEGTRKSRSRISIRVAASSAGKMAKSAPIDFPAALADKIRDSFRSNMATGGAGRMTIQMDEAAQIGKELCPVLFPAPVYKLFAQSLGNAMNHLKGGVRIRLALDETLVDLPWEYVLKPDRRRDNAMSSFLLLDPRISLVRQQANPVIALKPLENDRGFAFAGTLWEGGKDGWQVYQEYSLLREALKPVAKFIAPEFFVATDKAAFEHESGRDAAIFHYAGHCDFDSEDRPYLVREMPTTASLFHAPKLYSSDLAKLMKKWGTRFAVFSACNSGYWPVVKPMLDAGLPALLGVNGAVSSQSSIEFCAKLYESLAVGLTLDEAVARARLHLMQWGQNEGMFDWGLFMVYMPSPQSLLFPKQPSRTLNERQKEVRRDFNETIDRTQEQARTLDQMNFSEIASESIKHRVLILGRFTGRRLKVLKAIQDHLRQHPNRYIPELFVYDKPKERDLIESITAFASLSRFIVADLSEPKSIQAELQAIVPQYASVPVVPIINQTGKPYATTDNIFRRENVVKPVLRYRNIDDLLSKLDDEVVSRAEEKRVQVAPPVTTS